MHLFRQKLILLLTFLLVNLYSFSQKDSIVYSIDTVYERKEINEIKYDAPIHYTLLGLNNSFGVESYSKTTHYKSDVFSSPEIFWQHSNNKLGIEIAFQFQKHTEHLKGYNNEIPGYLISTHYYDSYDTNNILTRYLFTEVEEIIYYDSTVSDSKFNFIGEHKSFALPIRINYFYNHGYLRFSSSLGIIPTLLYDYTFTKENDIINFPAYSFSNNGEIRLGLSYWIFNKIFFHTNLLFSRSLKPLSNYSKSKSYKTTTALTLGFSYLIWDEIWE